MKYLILFVMLVVCSRELSGQSVRLLSEGTSTSLRGLSVVNDRVVWVSGSNGMVGRSMDSGNNWKWTQVKGYEKAEFRDIEAFDEVTAIVMGIGSPAYILKTVDGGEHWKEVFKDTAKEMFLDAMEFWNIRSGIVIGDPINGRFFVARTFDGGDHWQPMPFSLRPMADSGEACFASSGTNIRALDKDEAVFISGGHHSGIFIRDKKSRLPFLANGKESTGANSIAVRSNKQFMVVGGDFDKSLWNDSSGNCILSKDGGNSWTLPVKPPSGYRSCVEYLGKSKWITCGLNGVDISFDDGMYFQKISNTGFHVCRKAKNGKSVFFAGGKGRIGKLIR